MECNWLNRQCPAPSPLLAFQFVVLKWYESVCGWNELKVCSMLAYPRISSFHAMPVLYMHARILKPSEDSELTELKVDIAVE